MTKWTRNLAKYSKINDEISRNMTKWIGNFMKYVITIKKYVEIFKVIDEILKHESELK